MRFTTLLIGFVFVTVASGRAADVAFEKQVLTERFEAEGCAEADFDKDGHIDIAAGNRRARLRCGSVEWAADSTGHSPAATRSLPAGASA